MTNQTIDLNGRWEFKEYPVSARRMSDLENGNWQPATVPGSVFTNLIEAEVIKQGELFVNPEKFSFVSEKPWIYKKVFDVPEELLTYERLVLVFDGLDTVSNIWLNNKLIGKTNNMFVAHRFDVTDLVKRGRNELLVKFLPATEYANRLMSRYGTINEPEFSNPWRVFIRKGQFQFGWDFCPGLPGCGIWQGVRLEAVKKARIDDIFSRTIDCNDRFADVKITVKLDAVIKERYTVLLKIAGGKEKKEKIEQVIVFEPGEEFHSTVIRINKPAMWQPAGYGEANLYAIEAQLLCGDALLEKTGTRFGIRMVRLVQNSVLGTPNGEDKGNTFELEINGRSIYAKGANWVHPSIFAGSVTDEDYERLLRAASEAGINMLRVWGGGVYEGERFYRLCDELGIMVWQDFMFACGYYPDRGWFIDEVKKEAAAVIGRLRRFPSVVIWCGNNEIDWMHHKGKSGRKFYGREIFHRILPHIVAELDGDRPYIPTTPYGDKKSFAENLPLTQHRWDVWTGYEPVRRYIDSGKGVESFVVEFGLQSMPSMETLRILSGSDKPAAADAVIEKHNYQAEGVGRLYRYVCDQFGPAEDLEQLAYLSQVMQGRAAKLYVEHLRANKGKNSGVLFWQYNDCFPTISWSAIDFFKGAKALYYYAKRFYAPVLVTVGWEVDRSFGGSGPAPAEAIVVNDSSSALTARLCCTITDFLGKILDKADFPVSAGPFGLAGPVKLPRAMTRPAEPRSSVLFLSLEQQGRKISENFFLYMPDKYINWQKATIKKEIVHAGADVLKLKLKSNAFVKDLQIRCPAGMQAGDNFFDLPACREVTIDIASSHLRDLHQTEAAADAFRVTCQKGNVVISD